VLDSLQYLILKFLFPRIPDAPECMLRGNRPRSVSDFLGKEFLGNIQGMSVIDFGCGFGEQAMEIARAGAERVIGIDIRSDVLEVAREKAKRARLSNCFFVTETDLKADVIISIDSFEHFADPSKILEVMTRLLNTSGRVFVSFGPTWLHPLGGHLFSFFPWSHILFSEKALIRWRSDFKRDGARTFADVAGGLNKMTIGRFLDVVSRSPLEVVELNIVPIRRLRPFHNRFTREFTTSVVRCVLRPRQATPPNKSGDGDAASASVSPAGNKMPTRPRRRTQDSAETRLPTPQNSGREMAAAIYIGSSSKPRQMLQASN